MNIRLHCNGNILKNATWGDVEKALPELKEEAFFTLTIIPRPVLGPIRFSVESENGNYRPTMLVGGAEVRMFVNEDGRGKEDVEIGGYDYLAMSVTQDFDLIVSMIKEFYETGDVTDKRLW